MAILLERFNVESLLTRLIVWIPSLIAAIIILILFWVLFRVSRIAIAGFLARAGFDHALSSMLLNVYRFTLMAFGIVMAAGQLGINVGAALAGLGVVGLTVGFAAKDTLSNIMAGFLIFWDKPFKVGDWITVGDKYGKVAEITMRTTRLITRNNTCVIIPNETVINQVLTNHCAKGRIKVEVPVAIAYREEVEHARAVLLDALRRLDRVLPNESAVVVSALGPSGVDLLVQVWIAEAEQERPTFYRVLETSKLALQSAGIEIPFPHVQVIADSTARTRAAAVPA